MRLGLLWSLACLSGILGAMVLFDALPGINWILWTSVTIAGLIAYRRPDRATMRVLALPLGFALILATGASVTTTPILLVATLLIVASLMALALLVAPEHGAVRDYGAVGIITAPILGFGHAVVGTFSAITAAVDAAGSTRERPVFRGALLATPVVLVLALLFATADPVLGRGRDAIFDALSTFDALPRIIFGTLIALFVAGSYFASLRATIRTRARSDSTTPQDRIGLTERRIVLGAAAVISWLFVLLQIGYLFATVPSAVGSGTTFAEYAHRGFGELTVAATGVALLIVAAHQRLAAEDEALARSALMWPSLALLAAVGCILISAFHRISLYEDAYGFTTTRVYAQAYTILTLGVLVVLGWYVLHKFDVRAIARGVMTLALTTLAVLVFWNGDAWVARANVDRYEETGKIDIEYLARGLSPDAYPTLVASIPRLGVSEQQQLTLALAKAYARTSSLKRVPSWYEWNLRRSRAKAVQMAVASR
jgi:hypothetical protein